MRGRLVEASAATSLCSNGTLSSVENRAPKRQLPLQLRGITATARRRVDDFIARRLRGFERCIHISSRVECAARIFRANADTTLTSCDGRTVSALDVQTRNLMEDELLALRRIRRVVVFVPLTSEASRADGSSSNRRARSREGDLRRRPAAAAHVQDIR